MRSTLDRDMPMSSLEELSGQISAGDYTIDSRELAGDIVAKFALVRRVGRLLMSEGEADAERGPQPGSRRRASEPSPPLRPRRERLS
jgi:hypothetical protein